MKRLLIFILLTAISLLVITACSKKEQPVTKTPEVQPEEKEEKELFTYPYTGLETDEEPTNRAFAVMVNNQKEARPQSGLHEADIVFELLAEGNITRFLALYHSAIPERVGPVRSAREYYFRLAEDYGALYVYHGAAKFIDQMIQNDGIEFLNGAHYDNDKTLFIRESFRKAPHNSYMLTNELYNRAQSKGYETTVTHTQLPFLEEDETVSGDVANYVKITYFNNGPIIEYEYDETDELYNRFSDGEQTNDLETDTPIQLHNIFIIEADHQVIDNEGRRAIDLQTGGYGYLIQQGKAQHVEWENQNGLLVAVKEGKTIPFVRGKTWINVVQTTPPNNVEQVQIFENNE